MCSFRSLLDPACIHAPFQVYCDTKTHGGGGTLAYSYTVTQCSSFNSGLNAVTPIPTHWPTPDTHVLSSSNPPHGELSFGAIEWFLWKDIGQHFMVKSTINDWVVCDPVDGSIVEKNDGSLNCPNIRNMAQACNGTAHDKVHWWARGLALLAESTYYYFDGNTANDWPVHDPCGTSSP